MIATATPSTWHQFNSISNKHFNSLLQGTSASMFTPHFTAQVQGGGKYKPTWLCNATFRTLSVDQLSKLSNLQWLANYGPLVIILRLINEYVVAGTGNIWLKLMNAMINWQLIGLIWNLIKLCKNLVNFV